MEPNREKCNEISIEEGIVNCLTILDDYPILILELNEDALNFIYNENYEQASVLLQKAALLINKISTPNSKKNAKFILLSHHNLALCYQKYC